MVFGLGSYGFGLLAGMLSTLSPCVLPLVPILLGAAASAHPRAPLALAGGLAVSYAILGTVLAWAGAALGVDAGVFQLAGAALLGLIGVVLISGSLQQRFASATAGIGSSGSQLLSRVEGVGLRGQFAVGVLLGVVWSPCVGPTLGAAVVLASQGASLPQVALLMGLFGIGAALPLVALAHVSRSTMMNVRGKLMRAGKTGKAMMGIVMVAVAALVLSGSDKIVETWLLSHMPDWLVSLTTRF